MKKVTYNKILVTYDGSKMSYAAIPHALAIAGACQSEVVLLSVINSVSQETAILGTHELYQMAAYEDLANKKVKENKKLANRRLEKIKDEFEENNTAKVIIRVIEGSAPDSILDTAKSEKCHMIIMATHGRSGIKRAIIGSVADHVIRHAPCPVLVIHPARGGK